MVRLTTDLYKLVFTYLLVEAKYNRNTQDSASVLPCPCQGLVGPVFDLGLGGQVLGLGLGLEGCGLDCVCQGWITGSVSF